MSEYTFASEITDKSIIKKFAAKHSEPRPGPLFDEALQRLAEGESQKKDRVVVRSGTAAQFYEAFKHGQGKFLHKKVRAASELGGDTAEEVKIALQKIGSESKLNALRVARYGVKPVGVEKVPPIATD